MEIKQGDKVRVSRDIPQFYLEYNSYRMFEIEHRVVDVNMEDGFALLDSIPPKFTTILPTKYLVKVDAGVKEAKFKKGDKVRYIGNIQEHKGEMFVIDGDIFFNDYYKQWQASSIKTTPTGVWGICNVPLSDLEPDTKPTEQTEAEEDAHIRQMEAELDEFRKAELDRVLHPEKYYTYEVTIDNVAMNWQRYEADLAKELAIVYGKRGKSPLDAVAAAKEITKRLKQK